MTNTEKEKLLLQTAVANVLTNGSKSFDEIIKKYGGIKQFTRIGGAKDDEDEKSSGIKYQIYLNTDSEGSPKSTNRKIFTRQFEYIIELVNRTAESIRSTFARSVTFPSTGEEMLEAFSARDNEPMKQIVLKDMYDKDTFYQLITGFEVVKDGKYCLKELSPKNKKNSLVNQKIMLAKHRIAGLIWLCTIISIFDELNVDSLNTDREYSIKMTTAGFENYLLNIVPIVTECIFRTIYAEQQLDSYISRNDRRTRNDFICFLEALANKMSQDGSSVIRPLYESKLNKSGNNVIITPPPANTSSDTSSNSTNTDSSGDDTDANSNIPSSDTDISSDTDLKVTPIISPNIVQPLRYINQGANTLSNTIVHSVNKAIDRPKVADVRKNIYNTLALILKNIAIFAVSSLSLILLGFIGAILTGNFFIFSTVLYPVSVFITVGLFQLLAISNRR